MQTKLTRFADGLMEAVWLAAVIIVPVFFNIYSSRIFEPDKIALLRSLTLVGLAAWTAKTIALGRVDWGRLQSGTWSGSVRRLLKTPLVAAVLGLSLVYIIATIFSVTPRVSLFGSYQRLQGAYTTLSYVVLFAMVAVHMRRPRQVERLITTAILTSLPIGLYGILQRYEIDPIPWGGETAERVAANLGNSIFVAAYLIMAFPLTLGRIVDSFTNILDENQANLAPHIARGTVYVFTGAIQLIGVYFSLSRGPILGLLAGTFFMFVLLSLYWGKRWLTLSTVGFAAALGAFLVVFSIPGGPFEGLRSNENIGRIGNVFQTESGTGRVRVLIWQGAAELVGYHDPLEYPDGGKDSWNFLRPFIGYGPESMYVAYNSVYPPELADIESRNASPDRSHNETWDALVITGILGLAAEQFLFISVFYYGLKWLGLLGSDRQRRLFLGLIAAGGLLSSLAFITLIDIEFLGVGLPFGMLLGLLAYLTLTSVFFPYRRPETPGERARALTLMMFLGAIIAHYVEIHFGIAISATRLYFWIYSGALLAAGFWMTHGGHYGSTARELLKEDLEPGLLADPADERAAPAPGGRKSKRKSENPAWTRGAWIGGLTGGILLATLTFDYLTNPTRLTSITGIIRRSLTVLPGPDGETLSFGILALLVTAWLAWAVITASEWAREQPDSWRPAFLATAGISLGVWFLFATLHAGRLVSVIQINASGDQNGLDAVVRQTIGLERMVTQYYLVIFLLALFLGQQLAGGREALRKVPSGTGASLALAAVLGMAAIAGSAQLNLRVIHADIDFKIADTFTRAGTPDSWQVALSVYKRANQHAPLEDHYYLFLGKAYLELTRLLQTEDAFAVQDLLTQAESDLLLAQRINPLNTDHTANLARLYRFWSGVPNSALQPAVILQKSSDYYARAVVLSPNNSVIWNEWALLHLNELDDTERGLELLMHSLEIDPYYDGTYGILGDYYAALARAATDDGDRRNAAENAASYYTQALAETKRRPSRYLYAAAMGGVYELIDDLPAAVNAYLLALENAEENQIWLVEDTLAKVYARAGDFETALEYAALALAHAPAAQQAAQQELIEVIEGMQTPP